MAPQAFVFGQNLRDRVKLMNEKANVADVDSAAHPGSETPTATNYFLQYISSSADNSTHSADTSTKFVFGQNMSERVLVSGSAPHSDLVPLPTQAQADMLSPVQSDRTLGCRSERKSNLLKALSQICQGLASPLLSLLSTDIGFPVARAICGTQSYTTESGAQSLCPWSQLCLPLLHCSQDSRHLHSLLSDP